ncbi:MAG: transglutaminase family protein [Leptospiraceae bacterium]|nr:transglutaminase family protein [Leptospiraceae bacterium]
MSQRVALYHHTSYKYEKQISLSPQIIRLRPAAHSRTFIESYSLKISPSNHFINWQQDMSGNFLARIVFPEPVDEFRVDVDLVAKMTVINPFDFFLEVGFEYFPFVYTDNQRKELEPYLEKETCGPAFDTLLKSVDLNGQRTVDFLVAINQLIQNKISYLIRMEPGVQTPDETLRLQSGSCRDSSWLLLQLLRHLGVAARFVSGYLIQLVADEIPLEGPKGPEKDFTDLHAWVEAYIPGAGWIGLDPTSGLFAGEGHIPLAGTAHFASAAPIEGYILGKEKIDTQFHFEMNITRLPSAARVTLPYTEDEWQQIYSLGHQIDIRMREHGLKLTMGGEPTFVASDKPEALEWNFAAAGKDKRERAEKLLAQIADQTGKGGLPFFGQGKWYPGEELPRWSLTWFWRQDEVPLWSEYQLVGWPAVKRYYSVKDAEKFASKLAANLAIEPSHVVPGYEDGLYAVWQEGNLPANVDPLKIDLKDSLERKKLAKNLERGLHQAVGFALPIRYDEDADLFTSSKWKFRREHMFLYPGDSPMGLRLPLPGLMKPGKYAWFDPVFPHFENPGDLPAQEWVSAPLKMQNFGLPDNEDEQEEADKLVRTALCVEERDGSLYVFLPPLTNIKAWLRLVAMIEKTTIMTGLPIALEGYEPEADERIKYFRITPDPGVIEVNIHPAASWDELVKTTEMIYAEAKKLKLSAEKFMIDGRHTGTGGGNHVTMGAAYPEDSPFLLRPDLLRSLITFWQHHPSLSYLFSGQFIGPTSQAPRIDEARHDSLYELEIAFEQIAKTKTRLPWNVDRNLRNLLTDMTGNTHRAEFCIDKLYSPSGATGRLGLLEMRAFEMPPHWQMSSAQMLLLRALVTAFWEKPYTGKLVRWGTALHDKWMLPHYLWSDFKEVIEYLNLAQFNLQSDWFLPFFEFRFPFYGKARYGEVEMELRMALEPWNVLGEEISASGVSRSVDSAVERLQLKVTGLRHELSTITCNGHRLPLNATDESGTYVAGVRFKAWGPPSTLHPGIPVHSPLVFDLVDLISKRSLGGMTYFVSHPGGRSFEDFPVNASAAESRRIARFWPHGHTANLSPDAFKSRSQAIHSEFPYTLDLRKF